MRTSVHIPDDLLKRAKQKAAADGRTLTSLIEEGLRAVLSRQTTVTASGRKLPRTSTATGGLRPGIEPVKLLQSADEMDDIEMLDRLA
jgi:hypothetical protein